MSLTKPCLLMREHLSHMEIFLHTLQVIIIMRFEILSFFALNIILYCIKHLAFTFISKKKEAGCYEIFSVELDLCYGWSLTSGCVLGPDDGICDWCGPHDGGLLLR